MKAKRTIIAALCITLTAGCCVNCQERVPRKTIVVTGIVESIGSIQRDAAEVAKYIEATRGLSATATSPRTVSVVLEWQSERDVDARDVLDKLTFLGHVELNCVPGEQDDATTTRLGEEWPGNSISVLMGRTRAIDARAVLPVPDVLRDSKGREYIDVSEEAAERLSLHDGMVKIEYAVSGAVPGDEMYIRFADDISWHRVSEFLNVHVGRTVALSINYEVCWVGRVSLGESSDRSVCCRGFREPLYAAVVAGKILTAAGTPFALTDVESSIGP